MQRLSEVLKAALQERVLTEPDLYTTEEAVIRKMKRHPGIRTLWDAYRAMSRTEVSGKDGGGLWRRIPAKRRHIDPLVPGMGRVSAWSATFREIRKRFMERSQAYYVLGLPGDVSQADDLEKTETGSDREHGIAGT